MAKNGMTDLRKEFLSHLAILWRRRWVALITCWGLCLAGWVVVLLVPSQYRSQAIVYVDTDSLLGPLLKDLTVENDVQHQVPLIMKTLLSRPNLHKVAVITDLALAVHSPVDEVNLYEHLERHAQIAVQGPNLLAISYSDPSPLLAHDMVQALLSVLVDNSDLQNRAEMEKALGFIEKQIASYEEKLRTIEQRIADFKGQHGDVLVSSSANLAARKDVLRLAVSNAQAQVAELRASSDLLSHQLKSVPQFLSVENAPSVVVSGGHAPASLEDLRRELDTLRLQYTDKHPDVIAAQLQYDKMLARSAGTASSTSDQGGFHSQLSNPVFEQIEMHLLESERQLATARNHLSSAQSAQSELDVQAAENPSMVAQFTDLTREYDVLKKQYDELLVRRESALMSQAVENTSQKIQFRVVEPPRIPAKPSAPLRLILLSAVMSGSLVAAVALVFLLDYLETPVTSTTVIARHSAFPVLGIVSLLRRPADRLRERRWNLRFGLMSLSLLLTFCVLFLVTLQTSGLTMSRASIADQRSATDVG